MLCPFGLKGVDRHRYWVSTILLLVGRVNSAVDAAFTFSSVAGSPSRGTIIDRRLDRTISRGRLQLVNHQSVKSSRVWTPATVSSCFTMAARSIGGSSTSLSDFLQQASRDVTCTASRIHAFVGNEASDADSICSAICMAYLEGLSQEGRVIGGDQPAGLTNKSVELKDVVHVPVVPIPRADLALRREVLVLFQLCGVDPADLVFIDEINLRGLQGHGRLLVTLMDHNAVSGPLSELGASVVRIVDHHKDLGEHPGVRGEARDIAFDGGSGGGKALVGSCCTLVAERWLKFAPAMLPAEVAKLLLGVCEHLGPKGYTSSWGLIVGIPLERKLLMSHHACFAGRITRSAQSLWTFTVLILIDTMNFDVAAGRATPRDRAVVDELVIRAAMNKGGDVAVAAAKESLGDEVEGSGGGGQGDQGDSQVREIWEKLRSAKFDPEFWGEISVRDCLRYDYKTFTLGSQGGSNVPPVGGRSLAFGTSSMLCRLETLLRKPGAVEAMGSFAREREVEFVVVSTVTFDSEESGKMRKELLVFSEDRRRCRELEMFLEGKGGEFLDLERMSWAGDRGGAADVATAPGIDGTFALWEYRNLKVSRKQIVPVIISLYESDQGRV